MISPRRVSRGGSFGAAALMAIVALVVAIGPVEAQRAQQPRRGQDRAALEQRIRAQMGRMMSERLGLTEEERAALSEVVQGFEGRRRDLFREEQALRRTIERLTREDDPDQEEAAEALQGLVELQRREAELFAEEQAGLRTVLTPVQVLEFMEIREQIGRRIRALRGGRGEDDARRRRRGGDRGGAGPDRSPRAPPGAWGMSVGGIPPRAR